jgi:hypothetical protein
MGLIDFHKFQFIYCVNDEQQFRNSWNHASALNIPPGYTIDKSIIKNASSIAEGYNQAMLGSNAKYKLYLHQDVNILEPNFLYLILSLFKKNPNLGMLGVLGAKRLPSNGIWWEAKESYGKCIFFDQTCNCNTEIIDEYVSVQGIDGMIMITQYDIKWREDLFTGWHFYDVSQSLEFIKAGYTVGVPKQNASWCAHNCSSLMLPFQMSQQKFIQEYQFFFN